MLKYNPLQNDQFWKMQAQMSVLFFSVLIGHYLFSHSFRSPLQKLKIIWRSYPEGIQFKIPKLALFPGKLKGCPYADVKPERSWITVSLQLCSCNAVLIYYSTAPNDSISETLNYNSQGYFAVRHNKIKQDLLHMQKYPAIAKLI